MTFWLLATGYGLLFFTDETMVDTRKDSRKRIAEWIEMRTKILSADLNEDKARRQAVGEMEAAMYPEVRGRRSEVRGAA